MHIVCRVAWELKRRRSGDFRSNCPQVSSVKQEKEVMDRAELNDNNALPSQTAQGAPGPYWANTTPSIEDVTLWPGPWEKRYDGGLERHIRPSPYTVVARLEVKYGSVYYITRNGLDWSIPRGGRYSWRPLRWNGNTLEPFALDKLKVPRE